jgi:hypothetical protein
MADRITYVSDAALPHIPAVFALSLAQFDLSKLCCCSFRWLVVFAFILIVLSRSTLGRSLKIKCFAQKFTTAA